MIYYLVLSIITSVLFALCYKVAAQRNCNLQSVNSWNYIGATVTALLYIILRQQFQYNFTAILLGVISGLTAYFSTLTFFMHIRQGQLSTSWTIISLSLAFPVIASIFIWHESPNQNQIAAMALIVVALFLLGNSKSVKSESSRLSLIFLLIAFVLSGAGGIILKILIEYKLDSYIVLYTFALYGSGLILGSPALITNHSKSNRADRIIGSFMGLSCSLSTIFLLETLSRMQGIVVFPARSLGNLILTAVVSIILWKDRPSTAQWIGMGISLIAIWLVL